MSYQNLFYRLKYELVEVLSKLEIDNYLENQQKISHLIEMLRLTQDLALIEGQEENPLDHFSEEKLTQKIAALEAEQEKVLTTDCENLTEESCEEDDECWYRGQLHRKLRGGFIGEKDLFIPEKEIRELGATQGDWLQADLIKKDERTGRNIYDFQIVSKAAENERHDDRTSIDLIPVFHDELDGYYIDISTPEQYPRRVKLTDADIIKFQIESGDIIDYAYYGDKIDEGKVVWRYQAKELHI